MKTIKTFADEHGFEATDVWAFTAQWVNEMDVDQPLYAVLESYRVMEENAIHERDTEAFMDYLAQCSWDVEQAGRQFADAFHGQWESLEEYAEQTIEDTGFMSLKAERTGEEVWLSYEDVLKFCRDNSLETPKPDMSVWESEYTVSRNGYIFASL
ncbi:hypothetical protein [Streptomyces narbonensis]|uniref:hypothetical protein n=1 Tax=Streptomyces narbonensis TaxID=67333 RepID=UPI0033CE9A73